MNTLLISILLTFSTIKAENTENQSKILINRSSDFAYWIEEIKKHEGFAKGEEYICPAGKRTQGYGHLIKEGEVFPKKMTKEYAHNLLVQDFEKRVDFVRKHTDLKGRQLYAISHFVFAKGYGNFLRSTLLKKIRKKEPIDSELVKWCWYTNRKGEKVWSELSHRNRIKELNKYK